MQRNKITQKIKGLPLVTHMLVVLIAILSVMSPSYLTLMDSKNVLIQAIPLTIVAFGRTCIVLVQGTDLSPGAQVSFVIVSTVWTALRRTPLPAAVLFTILSTTLIGVVDGVIVTKGSIPPFIAIYGMQNILNSLSLLSTAGSFTYFQSFIYRITAETVILGVSLMVWAVVLVFIMVWMALNKTRSGTNIHGLGGNREALQLAGISLVVCLTKTYTFVGSIAGTAGVIIFSRIEAGIPTTVTDWEFQAVAATLLGGTSLCEGEGDATGTTLGVPLIQVIKNGLNTVGVQSTKQDAAVGSIVLMVIIIDAAVRTHSKEQGDRDMKAERISERIRNSRVFYSLIGLVILVIFSAITVPNFRTIDSTITVSRQASILLVLSAGLTAMLLTGGMDLSARVTAGFIGCICAQCIKNGVSVPAVFTLGILIRLVVDIINGLLAGILPSFIVTYGTNRAMSGLTVLVMQRAIIHDPPKGFTRISIGYTGSVPNLVIIAAMVVALIYVLLQKATYGRQVYTYGSNPMAAKYAAVPVKKIMLSAFMMRSVYAGLAGMPMTARLNAIGAIMGNSYGLQTVAAVVVDRIFMLGGERGVPGTVVGALIPTIIVSIMDLKGISSYAQGLIIGIVIIAMMLFDTYSKRKQGSKAT